jgi:hypothetical protein
VTQSRERERAAKIVHDMRSQLAYYDYLLPGDYVPEAPWRKRWFRWGPAFEITDELIEWAGTIARARSLMDLAQAAALIEEQGQ